MTENDARTWVADRFGDHAVDRLAQFGEMVAAENARQNLISPATVATIWSRHILDSAQLVPLAPAEGQWLDVGTGAGFPGMIVAMVRPQPTVLVEPRRQRATFLADAATALSLPHVRVECAKVERLTLPAAVISARAVAPIEKLLQAAAGCATTKTRWLLPRGRSGVAEVEALQRRWRGVFHMKQSLTDPESIVLVCDGPMSR